MKDEIIYHYFLECPTFSVHSTELLSTLVTVIPMEILAGVDEVSLLQIILFGSEQLDFVFFYL